MGKYTGNLCECRQPATWVIRRRRITEAYSVGTFASCDEHLAESARKLKAMTNEKYDFLTLTEEVIPANAPTQGD